jgi:hypothetical protein
MTHLMALRQHFSIFVFMKFTVWYFESSIYTIHTAWRWKDSALARVMKGYII